MTLFCILSFVAVLSSVMLITNKNPVYLVLSIVLFFVSVSALLLILGVDFLPFVLVVGGLSGFIFYLLLLLYPSNHYLFYFYWYFLLLFVSWFWLLTNLDNIVGLICGYLVTGLCFGLLIQIKYPKSLRKLKHPSFISILRKKQKKILVFLASLGGIAFVFPFFVPLVASLFVDYFYPLLFVPEFVIALAWTSFVSVLILFSLLKSNFSDLKNHSTQFKLSWSQRKLVVFFYSQFHARQDPFVWLLASVSFLSNIYPIILIFFGISLKYHNGVEIYCWFLICLNLTFVVTLPVGRAYIFKSYGLNSLRLTGWNGPEVLPWRLLGFGITAAGTYIAAGYAGKELDRRNKAADLALDRWTRAQLNKEVENLRLLDPKGAAEDKYPFYGPNDPLPQPTKHANVGKSGKDLIK